MNNGQLYFLIGLPRSGKSTIAQKFLDGDSVGFFGNLKDVEGFRYSRPRVVLALDSFRKAVSGNRYNWWAEPSVYHSVDIAATALLQSNYNVLIDDTHTTPESWKRIFRVSPNAIYRIVEVGSCECKRRAAETGQNDLDEVIDRLANNLEKMQSGENSIEKIRSEVKNFSSFGKIV